MLIMDSDLFLYILSKLSVSLQNLDALFYEHFLSVQEVLAHFILLCKDFLDIQFGRTLLFVETLFLIYNVLAVHM